MMIHKFAPSVDYNQWLKRLNTEIDQPTNQNLLKVIENENVNIKLCGPFNK